LTPWLLFRVGRPIRSHHSQPLRQTDANHPWVAQGDIVVTYLGLASAGTTGITGIKLPPTTG